MDGLGLGCASDEFCTKVFESGTSGSLAFEPSCDPNGCGPYSKTKLVVPADTTAFVESTWFILAEYPCVFRYAVTMNASLTSTVKLPSTSRYITFEFPETATICAFVAVVIVVIVAAAVSGVAALYALMALIMTKTSAGSI